MGNAKRRGTLEARVAQAQALAVATIASLRPDAIVCNGCKAQLTEVTHIPLKVIPGLKAAFVATCTPCKSNTFAVQGTDDALEEFRLFVRTLGNGDRLLEGVQSKNVRR